jgi:LysM repeat protein
MVKLLFAFLAWSSSPSDSLRIETVNGKQFIIHQVDPKETLYSLSKRYRVTVAEIQENNPGTENGISVGKTLRVPYSPSSKEKATTDKHVVAAKETLYLISRQYDVSIDDIKKLNNLPGNDLTLGQELMIPGKTTLTVAPNPIEMKSLSGVHTVVAKETMYSISRQYGITVQQLKEWNNLSDELPIGKLLVITQPKYNQSSVGNATNNPPTGIKISENMIGTEEVKEVGLAERMDGSEGNRKYLALHKTIKKGSIVKVRNEANNLEVFVRISGQLPSTSNAILQVSKSAYDRLAAADAVFRVEVTYYK